MENKVVYIKDVNEEVISPVTSASSVFLSDGTSIETEILGVKSLLDEINGEEV